MSTLNRYLAKAIANSTLLVLAVLVVLLTFFAFIDDLGDIGEGTYGMREYIQFTLLGVPQRIYELLPVSVLLGSLLGLGGLASNHELVAMRASGISIGQIIVAAMRTGLVFMFIAILMGEVIAPRAERLAQALRAEATNSQITVKTASGHWARDGRSFINVREILPDARLQGIAIYEFDDSRRLRTVTHARYAEYQDDHWRLQDLEQSVIGADGVTVRRVAEDTWNSILVPDLLRVVTVRPANLSVTGLYRYVGYLDANGLDSRHYRLAFWGKILQPLDLLLMLYLSIPFVFGTLRSVTVGHRILVGTLVGIAYYLLSKALGQTGLVYGLNPLFSVLFPPLLFFGFAAYRLRRVR